MRDHYFKTTVTKESLSFLLATAFVLLAACSDNTGTQATTTTSTTITTIAPAASLQLSASPVTVKSDNSNISTITITAVDAGNAVVPNTTVTLSTNTGTLSSGSVITDSTGKATLTFSSGTASKANRIATITATSGAISAQITVQITGSTVAVFPATATLPDNGSTTQTLTITPKDAGGIAVANTAVTLTTGGAGTVTLAPVCTVAAPCTTDSSGNLSVIVTGKLAGTVTVTATALGATGTATLTVSPSAATFAIDQQKLNGTVIANNTSTAMFIGDTLEVEVNAPAPTTSVVFATSVGVWNGTNFAVVVPVGAIVAGKAIATLTTTQAGVANIAVYDQAVSATSDSLTVTMTAKVPNSITLQPSPALVQQSTSTTTGVSTLTASVRDTKGYPVGGAQVAFSILNPTGGGETVSPVVVTSATATGNGVALGDASTTFTAGTKPSGAQGVQVRASVVGTAVATEAMGVDLTPSGNDASVVIGGVAGSVTFGQATKLSENSNATAYILAMSVQVADANGNPAPLGTAVNLSVWPIAWSTSSAPCMYDIDTATTGTFYNEDINENVNLDTGEDGTRTYYSGAGSVAGGTHDSLLTPPNSAGGTLPGTVYTDANGLATFNLTYTKTNAIWIVDRIRARTIVAGTEAVGQTTFRLAALQSDAGTTCLLPPSPYYF